MGAVPKNKITSSERGKRRAGNRPHLRKNPNHSKTPLHKRGLVFQMFKRMGIDFNQIASKDKTEKSEKVAQAKVQKDEPKKKEVKKTAKKTVKKTAKTTKEKIKQAEKKTTKPAQSTKKAASKSKPKAKKSPKKTTKSKADAK